MNFKNYYKILGVSITSSEEEIKKSYRKLAKKWHPDKNPGDKLAEDKFKEISEAYDVLTNTEKRRKFDDFLKYSQKSTTYYDKKETGYAYAKEEDDVSDFFKQFFKSNRKKKYFRGDDVRGKITVDIKEAYFGSVRIINTPSGKIRVKIKPGINTDRILKIPGKGKKSRYGGENGDLYIRIVVKNSENITRKGNDLYQVANIDVFTAVLGGEILINTLKGEIKIDVPENYKPERKLRLKGYGMPLYENPSEFGDLYLTLKYELPKNLSSEEKKIMKKLRDLHLKKSGKNL